MYNRAWYIYYCCIPPQGEGDDEEIWKNDLEEKFEVVEEKFDYAGEMKQKVEEGNQVIQHEME